MGSDALLQAARRISGEQPAAGERLGDSPSRGPWLALRVRLAAEILRRTGAVGPARRALSGRAGMHRLRPAEEQVVEDVNPIGDVDQPIVVRVRRLQAGGLGPAEEQVVQDVNAVGDVRRAIVVGVGKVKDRKRGTLSRKDPRLREFNAGARLRQCWSAGGRAAGRLAGTRARQMRAHLSSMRMPGRAARRPGRVTSTRVVPQRDLRPGTGNP
jgi:hypothetical protein